MGNPAYSATGFQRFFDRLLLHGLEWAGVYYGVYRAEVIDVVGFAGDPGLLGAAVGALTGAPGGPPPEDLQSRLKIRVPSVGDTAKTKPRDAFPIAPAAGKGSGFKDLPPKGSFVWVMFENGRLDIPLWFGGWWAKGEMPSELESPDARGWFTPGGHQILLDDTLGEETIRIKHKIGALIEIDPLGEVTIENFDPTGLGVTKVNIGAGANEAAILGDTLKGLLDELIDAIIDLKVVSPTGTTTPPINAPVFAAIKARLILALSKTVVLK